LGQKERKEEAFRVVSPGSIIRRSQRSAFARDRRGVKPGQKRLVELEESKYP
jgi:hypothetical protein